METPPLDFYASIERYGWLFILLAIIFRETIPAVTRYLTPGRLKRLEDQQKIETRSVEAIERIAENTEATRAAVAAINAYQQTSNNRLSRLEQSLELANRSLAIIVDRIGGARNENDDNDELEPEPAPLPPRRPRGYSSRKT